MKSNFEGKDIKGALDGTICRWKGRPVRVRADIDDELSLYTLRDESQQVAVIKHNDEDFDISTPPLGYMQFKKFNVCYITRAPLRMWKQGITEDNIRVKGLPNSQFPGKKVNMMTKAFEDMILGNYPPLQASLQELIKSGTYSEKAISRDCALAYDTKVINVFFKNDPVGVIIPKELDKPRPTVLVPSINMAKIVTLYLQDFNWEVV